MKLWKDKYGRRLCICDGQWHFVHRWGCKGCQYRTEFLQLKIKEGSKRVINNIHLEDDPPF